MNTHSLDQGIVAIVEFDKARSQIVPPAKYSIFDGNAFLRHMEQGSPVRRLAAYSFLPTKSFRAAPGPPMVIAGLPIQQAGTGNRHILSPTRVD